MKECPPGFDCQGGARKSLMFFFSRLVANAAKHTPPTGLSSAARLYLN